MLPTKTHFRTKDIQTESEGMEKDYLMQMETKRKLMQQYSSDKIDFK